MKQLFLTIFAVFAFLILADKQAFAYPHEYQWRTIETEHFRINYHDGLEHVAPRMARLAEHVWSEISTLLEYENKTKTEILLVDHVDYANGWVNVYPYNHMTLYLVPPDTKSTLNDYDDWMRVLIAHEMTHVVQLDTKSGVPAVINAIFGSIVNPNQYMPRWYTEGMAIFEESLLSAGGRNRSSIYDMYLRMNVYEDKLLEIDQLDSWVSQYPYGNVVYLYGARFMQYLADKYGDKTYAAMGYLYGQRLIPYGLNTLLDKTTDDNYIRLYEEWKKQLKTRYESDIERLETIGLTPPVYVTDSGTNHDSPMLFPSGRRLLYYHGQGKPFKSGWATLDVETLKSNILIEADGAMGATISPDGNRIITAQIGLVKPERQYYDLFLHDLAREKTTRLTDNARAREPAFAPDGKTLAYVKYTYGKSHLMLMNVDSGQHWSPLDKRSFDQVFTPVFSPDGRYIAMTGWRKGEFKDIYLFDTERNTLASITNDRALDMTPAFSPDGKKLYWSSDKTGIYNIFRMDMTTGDVEQVTNVIGGAFSPAVTPDGKRLFFQSYHSKGYDLAYIELKDHRPQRSVAMSDRRTPSPDYEDKPVRFSERAYSPFPSVYPKFWMPTMGEDRQGGLTLGARTWGQDIAGLHHWTAHASYGVQSHDPTLALSYGYQGFLPNLHMNASHSNYTLIDAGVVNGRKVDVDESRTRGGFSLGFRFSSKDTPGLSERRESHAISIGVNFDHIRVLNRYRHTPLGQAPNLPEQGLTSGLSLSWYYQDRERYNDYIGIAKGRAITLGVRASTSILGSKFNSIYATASYAEYLPNPFVENHTLALKLVGGFGATQWRHRKIFYIGGMPKIDVVDELVRNTRTYGQFLRGYKPNSFGGNRYTLFKSEYRFPLFTIDRGLYTLPIFFRRVHAAPFFDCGMAWSDEFDYKNIIKGIGGEVRLDFTTGYFLPITMRVGYQYGFDEKGVSSYYVALDNLF